MSTTSSCELCGEIDSGQHSLIHCNMARCVWALEDPKLVEVVQNKTEPTRCKKVDFCTDRYIACHMGTSPQRWSPCGLYGMHVGRPSMNRIFKPHMLQTTSSTTISGSLMNACRPKKNLATPMAINRTALRRWIPLGAGCCKIRVDGATSRATIDGSFSAIYRNGSGKYLGASIDLVVKIHGKS